ncbi:MAG: AraC family transcriptional regulator [Bryobacteraceae bacterium]|jgi:AraC-like DNA-binding protein
MRSRRSLRIVTAPAGRPFDAGTFARLCRARDYLAAHYSRPVFLAEAARQSSLSPFYFNRLFTQAFNETPHEFITRRRIEQAKKLLLAGNHSVTEICFEVGYESLGSFSTRFHSLTGLSPAAFRSEARRVFGGFGSGLGARWPLYYIPACFQRAFLAER